MQILPLLKLTGSVVSLRFVSATSLRIVIFAIVVPLLLLAVGTIGGAFLLLSFYAIAVLFLELCFILCYPLLYLFLNKETKRDRLGRTITVYHYDIIIHAASVGEINGIKPLISSLLSAHPSSDILLTTNTINGKKCIQNWHERLHVQIAPLDILHLRIRQIYAYQPKLLIFAETEVWTQALLAARLMHIPVVFINARMSDRSFKRYRLISAIIGYSGGSIKAIGAQTEDDAQRFSALIKTNVEVTGNLKFCVNLPDYDSSALRHEWGFSEIDKIIVLGSSRPGEEEVILSCYDSLKPHYPSLKLIIAPRHLDRMPEIKQLLSHREVSFHSEGTSPKDIHIIDCMGILTQAYALCDIAIIGGSFFDFKGHNPLEATYYSCLTIMGPYHQSCKDTVQRLSQGNGILLSDATHLCTLLQDIFEQPAKYAQTGINAKRVMESNQDALPHTLALISKAHIAV